MLIGALQEFLVKLKNVLYQILVDILKDILPNSIKDCLGQFLKKKTLFQFMKGVITLNTFVIIASIKGCGGLFSEMFH